jgi:hypothetical protein
MKNRPWVFNGFLVLLLLALTGCATGEERKRNKETSSFRVHLESDPGSADRSSAISIHRSAPILVNIDREAILDERNVTRAAVVDQAGGLFAVEIQLDRRGSWILERTTVVNRSRHLVFFSQFGDQARWLAAPVIATKNSGGRLLFTPDATREEAERFVRGLNNVVHKLNRDENWPFKESLDH